MNKDTKACVIDELGFLKQDKDGVKLAIRLTPKSSKCGMLGLFKDVDNREYIKIAVNAPPADGKANSALEVYLAKALRLPKSSVLLFSGFSDRRKIVLLKGDYNRIKDTLCQMLSL